MAETIAHVLADTAVVDIDGNQVPKIGAFMEGKRAILFVNVATK